MGMEGHNEHLATILDHVEPAAFLEQVMTGRGDEEEGMTLAELRAEFSTEADAETEEGEEGEESEGEELEEGEEGGEGNEEGEEGEEENEEEEEEEDPSMAEEEQDGDVHYVASASLIELEKMHAAGNATKEGILAQISDEHEETLPDEEVMVPIKMEGHNEHFPTILDHVEPTAFLEKVMAGRNDPELKSMTLAELRAEENTEEEAETEEGEEGEESEGEELEEGEEGEEGEEEGEEGEQEMEGEDERNAETTDDKATQAKASI